MSGPRACVVGAGIAGIACARVLHDAGVEVTVRERGRAVGGRMASRTVAGRPVDTGAQYFTVSSPGFATVVQGWRDHGLARPWTDAFRVHSGDALQAPKPGPMRWAAARGLRSLVADLGQGLDVRLESTVDRVQPDSTGRPEIDGTPYDVVVLAMPDPQALRLLGAGLSQERAAVADRTWKPQLALLAGWPARTWDAEAVFVNDDEVLSFVADDGARRGDGAPVLVAHSTAAFAAARLAEPEAAGPVMVTALRRVLGLTAEPSWSQVHRWTFAKPAAARDEAYLLTGQGIGLCGDGWGAAKVETAWQSGDALGRALLARG